MFASWCSSGFVLLGYRRTVGQCRYNMGSAFRGYLSLISLCTSDCNENRRIGRRTGAVGLIRHIDAIVKVVAAHRTADASRQIASEFALSTRTMRLKGRRVHQLYSSSSSSSAHFVVHKLVDASAAVQVHSLHQRMMMMIKRIAVVLPQCCCWEVNQRTDDRQRVAPSLLLLEDSRWGGGSNEKDQCTLCKEKENLRDRGRGGGRRRRQAIAIKAPIASKVVQTVSSFPIIAASIELTTPSLSSTSLIIHWLDSTRVVEFSISSQRINNSLLRSTIWGL